MEGGEGGEGGADARGGGGGGGGAGGEGAGGGGAGGGGCPGPPRSGPSPGAGRPYRADAPCPAERGGPGEPYKRSGVRRRDGVTGEALEGGAELLGHAAGAAGGGLDPHVLGVAGGE